MTSDIDVGGVKPLVTRTEIHCGRTGNSRTNAGKPAYKSQEEQYQEIQELRRHLGELREENSGLKTRTRRLEEDLIRRDRQIEQLMDPAKNDEARRKLTDKGASLVSSLKLRVSRLESTLKDKEAELAKLQASAKATALNELKIEAETYYQEVVRLRNQLNVAQQHQQQQQYQPQQHQQHQQHQQQHHHHQHHQQYQKVPQQSSPQHTHAQLHLQPPTPPDGKSMNVGHWSNLRGSGRDSREGMHGYRDGGDGQESPTHSLRHALTQMEEENARLGQQVAALATEKAKLTADIERVLGLSDEVKSNYEGFNRAELIREIERRHEEVTRLESQHSQLTEALARRNDLAGDSGALLQARVSELQAREVEWERERSSMRELINTLKDDRLFYKETAQKKESELDGLRQEIQTLQQEVISLHDQNRRRNDRPTPPPSQRSVRGTARPTVSSASRSGSSSEANTPTRRPRTSSARPPPASTRTQRSSKSSSEPREIPPQSKSRKTPTPQTTKKSSVTKSSSRQTSSTSSPSKVTPSSLQNSVGNARPSSGSRRTTVSSASSSPKASPYASPKHTSTASRANSVSASKTPTPLSSPRKTAGSASPQQKPTAKASPQHKQSGLPSPSKVPTSRASSRTSTPSSSVKSSPSKVSSTNRSPSKVPLPSKTSSPSKAPAKKREESASPARSPKTTVKQDTVRESSLYATSRHLVESLSSGMAPGRRENRLRTPTAQRQEWRMYHSSRHVVPQHHRVGSSHHTQDFGGQEEDEEILAEIIFHRETDSSGEASDPSHGMVRQRTMTLSTQEDQAPSQGEQEDESESASERAESSSSLIRQNTVTLSKSEESEIRDSREGSQEVEDAEAEQEEERQKSEDLKSSRDTESPVISSQDTEIIENLELLQSLLSSHLSRQREVNELLSQEPLLVGEGQPSSDSSPSVSSRRRGRSTREAPDGEEASRGSSKRSQSLVRQGTFNVSEQETTVATIHATLDAHLTRVNKVHHFSTKQ
ncbi:serine/arginine repetitive matrix protein 2-like isoform X3 [Penaeus japonicus]|uniref:serine/arginine repetitive matrix protein 2-like isoform X3 n=1 Tax=Penaeus japonicus TaxID=27405 RepID=UPI001C7141CF|nr:serine/arginine repetitive matrix protein 2-like isoform X3 [Penaeus japonicus]